LIGLSDVCILSSSSTVVDEVCPALAAYSAIVDDWAMAYFEIYLPVLIFDGLRSEWLANGQVFPGSAKRRSRV
jgi:hypothetical protein